MSDQNEDLPVRTPRGYDGPVARCSWGRHLGPLLDSGLIGRHHLEKNWINPCPGASKPPRTEES